MDDLVRELVFVVVAVLQDSDHEIGMVVLDARGEMLRHGRADLDYLDVFLEPWLNKPFTHVKFVCSFLSGYNTRIVERCLTRRGHTTIGYNGIAYAALTDAEVRAHVNDDMSVAADLFASRLNVTTLPPASTVPTTVYLSCTYRSTSGLSIAAGTLRHGVQVATRVHYSSDICDALAPWFVNKTRYRIVLVVNYSSQHALTKVDDALVTQGHTIHGAPVDAIYDPGRRLGRFFDKDASAPNFIFARCVLEMFLIEKRCQQKINTP